MEIMIKDTDFAGRVAMGAALCGLDGQEFRIPSLAALAGLPELTEGGRVVQEAGGALLGALFAKACKGEDIDPGFRMVFPYREIEFEGEKRVLFERWPYEKGHQTFNPRPQREQLEAPKAKGKGKDGGMPAAPTIENKDLDIPYLFHVRRLYTVDIEDGEVQLNNPEKPPKVTDLYRGRTDHLTWQDLTLSPAADHKEISMFGFHMDQASLGRWRESMKAQAGAHAHLEEVYNTSAKGWIRFPGCAAPHYICGDRDFAPAGGPTLKAVARGGSGLAPSRGVSVKGTLSEWVRAMRLVLQNPDMAALLGFSASSALLGRIKEMESGIVHLVGGSSKGKSTALKVGASLIGSADGPREANAYIDSWAVTDNAIEGPLEARSDAPTFRDELSELPHTADVQAMLYRATNGRGKQRMTRDTESRAVKVWRTQILSTGEVSFSSRINQGGQDLFPGGLQFRVMELHIETIPFWSHVAAEGENPGHGAYKELVETSRASAPTPQARIIEAIEMALKENHGHFWERWIAMLQTEQGMEQAASWFESERADLEKLIPAGANPIYIRRTKHVAAAMAGLRGVLAICGFGEEFDAGVLGAARAWSREHLWPAGIDVMGKEAGELFDRFQSHILSREGGFVRAGAPYAVGHPTMGWIDHDGGCAIPGADLRRIAADLKIDCGRLETTMRDHGWSKQRKRHPSGSRESAANRVWFREGVFRKLDRHGRPVEDQPLPAPDDIFGGESARSA